MGERKAMNIAPELLNYLSGKKEFTEIILAPKASPVERKGKSLRKVLDILLSPEDIRDTLVSLRSHTPASLGPLGREGFFSFGMAEVGRVRVTYLTQRGSYVVSVVKVPYDIPALRDTLVSYEEHRELMKLLIGGSGIVVVISQSFALHSMFAYSLLKELSKKDTKLIYILEKPLTYLLGHSNSIVIQREVGIDVNSFEEGIEEAFLIHPDVIYLSDMTSKESVKALRKLTGLPVLSLVGITTLSIDALRGTLESYGGSVLDCVSKVIEVEPAEEGRIRFKLTDI